MDGLSALRRPLIAAVLLFVASTVMARGAVRYVALTGNDSNPGTLAQPYRTIQKCATTVANGSTCLIRAGRYGETVTPNSGITIAPYQSEAVVVEGTNRVTGWQLYRGNIYRARVTLGTGDTNQIFVNRQMMTEARWPKSYDLFHPVWATAKAGTTGTVLVDPSLPNVDWTGAHVHFWSGMDPWDPQTGVITAATRGRLTFTPDGASFPPYIVPQAGGYYFLFGKLAALTAEGEWFYDRTDGTLYLWAPGGANPNSLNVSAKTRPYGFDLSGRSHVTIRGLALFATTITTDSSSANNVIDGITATYISHYSTLPDPPGSLPHYYWILHVDDSGIVLKGSGHVLKNSTISHSAGNGVTLFGTHHTVENNLIHHIDYMANYASGVAIEGVGHAVRHNTIHTTGRFAILVHSLFWTGSPPSPSPPPTNIDIAYNNLFYASMLSRDAGEIYNGYQTCVISSAIRYNWLHDTRSRYSGPASDWPMPGVYLDENACGWQVYQNVLWNNQSNLFVHGSTSGATHSNNNIIRNNSVIDIANSIWLQDVTHCGATSVHNNYILAPLVQTNSPCRVVNNSASAPGADAMTGVRVGCNFTGCSSAGPPRVVNGKVAASIAGQPFSVRVSAGERATFSVIGAGSPPLVYQWKRNGAAISGATQATYQTPNTQASDNGAVYTVVVRNAISSVGSDRAVLTVR